jgi:hypothetical protein
MKLLGLVGLVLLLVALVGATFQVFGRLAIIPIGGGLLYGIWLIRRSRPVPEEPSEGPYRGGVWTPRPRKRESAES